MHRTSLLAHGSSHSATPIEPCFDAAVMNQLHGLLEPLIPVFLTKNGIRKGLNIFGDNGDAAVEAEMREGHELKVIETTPPTALKHSDKKDALQYNIILKNSNMRVKGRGCAYGRKKRTNTAKIQVSYPTIATESVFFILVIAAKDRRDVMTMEITENFIQTPLSGEWIQIRLEGRMAEILAMIDPKLYCPKIIVEQGKPVFYAELLKELYGIL